jgi:hypothetical protein
LIPIVIERLGSSTCSGSSAIGFSGSASVSPIVMSSKPATATMSPGPALWAGMRSSASVMKSSVILACSIDPSMRHHATRCPRQTPQVRGGVEVADQRLEPVTLFVLRRRDEVGDRLEERREVARGVVHVERGPTLAGARVEDGKGDLVFVGVEVEEEVLHLGDDLLDSRVGPVDLVDDEHDREALLEGLSQHETGLGQGTLGGVDQQDDGVDHRQAPLDLAAEVGVTRRVDDVDREVVPLDGGVLGEDGDALFAFEVARVHDPVGQLLVGRE